MKKKIMCPYCAEKGLKSWIGSEDGLAGEGMLYLWCKKCKREVRIDLIKHKGNTAG